MDFKAAHRACVAPMMQYTDMHDRYLLRLISKNTYLYTEMITTGALIFGKCLDQLDFNKEEHPVAVQLGGSDLNDLIESSKISEGYGYDEINLNVGCPSDRVQKGRFGACLMLEPEHVANCLSEMQNAVTIPVTIKCRLGIDDNDSYEFFENFVNVVKNAGIKNFIIHARNGILSGLSPRQNRMIPPLKYDFVYELKKDNPDLNIIINGGIKNLEESLEHLGHVDGVMIGRAAYDNPFMLSEFDEHIYGQETKRISKAEIFDEYVSYMTSKESQGYDLSRMVKHLFGLSKGDPHAKAFRKLVLEAIRLKDITPYKSDLRQLLVN